MFRFTRTRLVGKVSRRSAIRRSLIAFSMVVLAGAIPSAAQAAFNVTGFSVTANSRQAAGHPNLTVLFNRGESNTEDLRDFTIDYPTGMLFNPQAAVSKCTSTQFASDLCPSASVVGDFTALINLEILGFSFPATANGTIYVLAPTGVEHGSLGYVLRPTGYAKTFSKQSIQLKQDSDGGPKTVTTNQMRAQAVTWPRLWGSTNIAVRRLTMRYNARSNAAKTGPFFTLNPSSCSAAPATLSATSYASEAATGSTSYTPQTCTSPAFAPTMSVDVDDTTSDAYTGATFNVSLPMAEATIQNSTIKSISAQLPVGTGLNLPLLSSFGPGCLESELLADSCPEQTLVGEVTASLPFFPPEFTGELYLMDPTATAMHGAVVLRGPRNMKTIIRFSNTVQGSGSTARVLSSWDYMPQVPISKLQVHVSQPFFKNPACPGGAQTSDVTLTGHSNKTRTINPAYATTCTATPPPPPVITDPVTGTPTNDSTPTFTGTAIAGATITVYDGAASIGTTTANAAGDWTFTPASSIGTGLSSISATATTGAGTSSASAAVQVNVDTVAPPAPVVTTNGGPTNDNTPTFGGIAEDFSTIAIRNGATLIGTTSTDASGIWSYTPSTLPDGAMSITVTATDAAGNISAATSPMSMTIDTISPPVPTITTPVGGSTTNDNTPSIGGAAEIGSTVRVSRLGNVVVCTATASITGSWTCDASPALPAGSYAITAISTDAAGNVSVASSETAFTVASFTPVRITTGPEGGLQIDAANWDIWYYGGTDPGTGDTIAPHPDPRWSFTGAAGEQFECSLQRTGVADSFSPCTSPYTAAFNSLDDSLASGTEYKFVVRQVTNTSATDTAIFKVGPFSPTYDVSLSTYQAMAHPDVTVTATNPFGDAMDIRASMPDHFWGSLAAIPNRCSVVSAQAGTCATTAPNSKIGSITFTADVNPNPHNETVPAHQVTRTFDTYLTPPTQAGDAGGAAISIRAVDDAAYGSRDYGTINYIGRLRLRYEENVIDPSSPAPNFSSVNDPTGMDLILEDIPNSTLPGPGVTSGPAGAADLHVRSMTATVLGNAPWYSSPLLYNSSQCPGPADVASSFDAFITSTSFNTAQFDQSGVGNPAPEYRATGCENLEYEPVVTQFSISDNGATDLVNDIDVGMQFPAGNSTTKSAIVDMPREFVANTAAVQACLSADVMVADPQANCPDTANLGTATATTPLLPYPLVGDVIGEDVGGSLPNIYMVFKDPDLGLDTRIRGSAEVLKTGTSGGIAQGDFIRTRLNVGSDGGPLDLPSMPLSGLVLNLHQEDAGVVLPDSTTSLGSIIKIGTGYACNDTAAARFIMQSWSGVTRQVMSPPVSFNCGANGQTPNNGISILSGPANGEVITTNSVTFTIRNNLAAATKLRVGNDDGTNAIAGDSYDANIETTTAAPNVAAGANRVVTFAGLTDGRVYKFLVQNTGAGASLDQERRVYKVDMNTGPPQTPTVTSPVSGLITSDNTITLVGTASSTCTVSIYNAADNSLIGSTTPTAAGDWSFTTQPRPEGVSSFTTRCLNAAGDQSAPSPAVSVTVDTIPPTAPVISSPEDAQVGSVSNVVGTAEPGSTVTVSEGATVVCTAVTNASGGWMCSPASPPFSAGNHVICARATDAAANTGVSDCVQFGDASAAKARIITGPEGGFPIDVTSDAAWYAAGNYDAEWSFDGGGASASYECSLVKAAQADSFAPCTSPFRPPFDTLDDSVPAGTDYRFRVRIAGLAASVDTALFKVGQFNPTWDVQLSTHQALGHPDMTVTFNNPVGRPSRLIASTPDNFMGSLAATERCPIANAQVGTCATTTPSSKIGTVTFVADVNPVPHNDSVPPHQVTRTFDAFLTPASAPGDAAGIALSIRAIDDPAYGNLDYGTINYIARMKLRYDGPGGAINYLSVFNPRGMDFVIEDMPTSTALAPGVTPGPAGVSDLHVRSISAQIDGTNFSYSSPLLYNSSSCEAGGQFTATMESTAKASVQSSQPYQATGCENVEYTPAVQSFGLSDNGATDKINDLKVGVTFPEGTATTRTAIVDLPREFVAETAAVQACPTADLLVANPQDSCDDTANLGTATVDSPLLPYPLVGDVIGEDVGGTLPSLYMVFKDPDIGLDARIRGAATVIGTGVSGGRAAGDFIRVSLNVTSDGLPTELPSIPLSSLVVDFHQENAGVTLPDNTVSLGPILKVGTTYACNDTSVARFTLTSWNGLTSRLVSPPIDWNCAANGQTPVNTVRILSGPVNGVPVTTSSVTFEIQNNHTSAVRLRTGLDDGTNAEALVPYDANIEPNTTATPTTAAGASRFVTYTGLQDGRVYKFLVQNNASGSAVFDQERRTFRVELP